MLILTIACLNTGFCLRLGQPRSQSVPLRPCLQILTGFKGLRHFIRAGDALRSDTFRQGDFFLQVIVKGIGQIDTR